MARLLKESGYDVVICGRDMTATRMLANDRGGAFIARKIEKIRSSDLLIINFNSLMLWALPSGRLHKLSSSVSQTAAIT